LTNFNKATEV